MARILLIDDDQAVLDLEKLILYEAGHEILEADNALFALDLLELYEVDLIVVDIEMPRINGFQFVSNLRSLPHLRAIPIAFLTASLNKSNVLKAAKLGSDFYILKPLEKKEFLEKMADFFAKHPPKNHAKIEYPKAHFVQAKIRQGIEVCSVSDFGVEIIMNHDLELGQILEFPAALFQDVFQESPLLKVLSVRPHEGGGKKISLVFVSPEMEIVRKIQRLVLLKNQPVQALKYPKSR